MDMNHYVHFIKECNPRRYRVIMHEVNEVCRKTTLEELSNIANFVNVIYSDKPKAREAFYYLLWQRVSELRA